MNKLEQAEALIGKLRNDSMFNLLTRLLKNGELIQIVYAVVGALLYLDEDNKDKVTLRALAEILK